MTPELSDADILALVASGCNAAEIAAYAELPEPTVAIQIDEAQARQVWHYQKRWPEIGFARRV